ncbi:hypothetical protein [Paenibacillus tengchongensis]|uniref:hypothetical protein n=1 Tax=Paenibacillus tengchongensis TaxID=2608684 RepID=UPI00124EA36C|nr:hypothetical protein [Paenibacillus tengchongensis]
MIRNKYAHVTVSELSDEYFLSFDSIKKIIYKKNGGHLTYAPRWSRLSVMPRPGCWKIGSTAVCGLAAGWFRSCKIPQKTNITALVSSSFRCGSFSMTA